MAENDVIKRLIDAGVAFTEMTRQRAEQIVADLTQRGETSVEEVQASVEHILQRSREAMERLGEMVRDEVTKQLKAMGVGAAPAKQTAAAPAKKAAPKKAAAKKAGAKKATAKKATAKKGAAKKTAAKKATPRKAAAKKAVAKKSAAPRKAAKKAAKASARR
jgi:polyhydroxyalkanoate synthesis regulator phasin